MTDATLKDILARAERWPPAAQRELADVAREIEAALAGPYRATASELSSIDRGLADADAGRFAAPEQIAATFARHRRP
jgi:predicted transcriptional regulator